MTLPRREIRGTPRLRDQILRLHPDCEVGPGAMDDPREHLEQLLVRNPLLGALRRLIPPRGRVLIAGTGTGEIAAALASRAAGIHVAVADDDGDRLRLARGWAEALGLRNVSTVRSRWPEVEVDGLFEVAFVPHLAIRSRQPEYLLGRLCDHLSPGGWLVEGLRSTWGSWQSRIESPMVLLLAGRELHEKEGFLEQIAFAAAQGEPAATPAFVASRLHASHGDAVSVGCAVRRMRDAGLRWTGCIPSLSPFAASLDLERLAKATGRSPNGSKRAAGGHNGTGKRSSGREGARGWIPPIAGAARPILGAGKWLGERARVAAWGLEESLWSMRLRPWGHYLALARRPETPGDGGKGNHGGERREEHHAGAR